MSSVLFAALALLHAPAHACSPGPAMVDDLAPADDQADVPVDAVIRAFAGSGYVGLDDTPEIRAVVDGVAAEGTIHLESYPINLTREEAVVTFTPSEPFPAGALVEVAVYNVGWNGAEVPDATWSFTTGDRVVEEAEAATLSITSFTQTFVGGETDSCETESVVSLQVQVELAAADADGLTLVRLYQVEEGVLWSGPSRTWGPVGATTSLSFSTTFATGEESWGERCFAAVVVDGAGRESEPSETVCASVESEGVDLDWTDKGGGALAEACGGCATGAQGMGLTGLALAMGMVLRRRRA